MVKMSECQTAWIQVRRRVTRRLIRIQAVCIRNFGCALRAKGLGVRLFHYRIGHGLTLNMETGV